MNDTTKATKSNTTIWLLLAISILPFIAASIYYNYGDFKSFGNNGDLINPVIDVSTLELQNQAGVNIERESLTKKWRMLLVMGKDCDDICKTSLYNMRQINVALGKHYDRFRHMLIHTDKMNAEMAKLVNDEYTETLHAYAKKETLDHVLKDIEFDIYSGSILIMDPIGNIMMRFKTGMDPKVILKDLNRLLKVSQIG